MLHALAAAGHSRGFDLGLAITALGFGFRHGIDWDHIAALTDITSSQDVPRRSFGYATLYALGHALVVFVLGVAAIVASEQLPSGVDAVMERVVGVTLLLLGVYVFYGLVRHGRDFRMRSRWMLLFSGTRHVLHRLRRRGYGEELGEEIVVEHDHDHPVSEHHEHDPAPELAVATAGRRRGAGPAGEAHRHGHRHVGRLPDDPFATYGRLTSFAVGMVHGIGAETPTQVLIFLTAAGAAGRGVGLLLLGCFIAGLLTSNSLIALAGTVGFLGATRRFWLYATVSVVTAGFSLVIGSIFLLGRSAVLPALVGG